MGMHKLSLNVMYSTKGAYFFSFKNKVQNNKVPIKKINVRYMFTLYSTTTVVYEYQIIPVFCGPGGRDMQFNRVFIKQYTIE